MYEYVAIITTAQTVKNIALQKPKRLSPYPTHEEMNMMNPRIPPIKLVITILFVIIAHIMNDTKAKISRNGNMIIIFLNEQIFVLSQISLSK